jgi:hypothetical protein
MATNHINAFVADVKQAIVPLILRFNNVDTHYGTAGYRDLYENAIQAMKPLISDLSISGACVASKILWDEWRWTDELRAPTEYEALSVAAGVLESFIAEARPASSRDAKARVDYFIETESRCAIGDDDRTILMHNIADELRFALSAGVKKRPQGGMSNFGAWQPDWSKRPAYA